MPPSLGETPSAFSRSAVSKDPYVMPKQGSASVLAAGLGGESGRFVGVQVDMEKFHLMLRSSEKRRRR